MRASALKALIAGLDKLSVPQLDKLAKAVSAARSEKAGLEAIETANPVACRHCNSVHVVRYGHRGGLQRYRCKDCGKTCNATTGTPLSRLRHRELFEAYARCMAEGLSVRRAAAAVGICVDTAHRWRLRFLTNVVPHQPKGMAGMLEVDETYFRESQKGSRSLTRPARHHGGKGAGKGRKAGDWVPVLVGRVRGQPHTVDKVLPKLNGDEVTAALQQAVKPGETVVCTDGHSAFLRLQKTLGVETKYFVAGYHGHAHSLNKVYHVQTANNYHERLKSWINRQLRGVATKNLPFYLAWMRLWAWSETGVRPEEVLFSALGRQVINL